MVDNYPRAWPRFTAHYHHSHDSEPKIGNFGQLAKWSARFRLAKSFRALDLGDAYANLDTPLLYSAITRIFLTYSAFETYCHVLRFNIGDQSQMNSLEDNDLRGEIIRAIRNLDPGNDLPQFLVRNLDGLALKQILYSFIEGNSVNVSCFARSIRHVFAHGVLSAHAVGLSSQKFDQISQLISEFLLDCMDEDFDRRVPD